MEKRLVLTIAISVAILVAYSKAQQHFAPRPLPAPPPTAESVPPPLTPPGGAGDHAQPTGGAAGAVGTIGPGGPGGPGGPAGQAQPEAKRAPEELTVVDRPRWFRAEFSTWGAVPTHFELADPQYKTETADKKTLPIDMVDPVGQRPFVTYFQAVGGDGERSDFAVAPDAAWTLARKSDAELVYTLDVGPVHLEKTWRFPTEGFELGVQLTVENRGDKPLNSHLLLAVGGFQDPTVKQGGMLSMGKRVNLRDAECHIGGKVHRVARSSSGGCGGGDEVPSWGAPFSDTGELKWLGIGEQFFLAAAALGPDGNGATCRLLGETTGHISARAIYPAKTIPAGGKITVPFSVYAGPKVLKRLDAVTVAGQPAPLDKAVDYTLEAVAIPLQKVLSFIHMVIPNWGLSIIVITFLLKLVMFVPTQSSMRSMKEMGKLKPKIDAIKAKYPSDSVRQNQETMALYKEHGVNPLGSCLPMMLQLPIYFAFYSMLSNAVELYRAPFFGPMDNMTAPVWPLSIATGVLMFIQQKVAPQQTGGDPAQQKMLQYMPLMFTVMTLQLPSGLTLYIFTNTLLTMVQQWWMNRADDGKTGGKGTGSGSAKGAAKTAPKPARA